MRARKAAAVGLAALGTMLAGAAPAAAATEYGDVCGLLGSPAFCAGGEFNTPIGVAVDNSKEPSAGDVYVADIGNGRVVRFDSSGKELSVIGGFVNPAWDAVDPATGDLYVTDFSAGTLSKFDAAGAAVAGFGTAGQITGLATPSGVAVDPSNGHVFLAQRGNPVITEYDSSGKELGSFPAPVEGAADGIAVDSEGNVYAVEEKAKIVKYPAANRAEPMVFDTNQPFSVTVDVTSIPNHVFVAHNTGSGPEIAEYDPAGTLLSSFGLGDFSGAGSAGLAINANTHALYASDIENNRGLIFEEGETPEAPRTDEATEITRSSALLHGELNPKGATGSLKYHFAYETGGGCTGGGSVPEGEAELGEAKEAPVEAPLTGLEPNKHYTFCLFASNPFGSEQGPPVPFTTLAAPPEIDSENASGPDSPSAVLEAQVNPNNQETKYSFEYATKATGQVLEGTIVKAAGASALPAAFGDQLASVDLGGGLAPAVYYYRVVAENKQSEVEAKPSEFEVKEFARTARPLATAAEAGNPTASTIVLSGSVNPQGADTTYHFEIVTEAAYQAALAESADDPYATGRSTPTTDVGSDYTTHPTGEVKAVELLPGTTYRYALVATNEKGTTLSSPGRTFTTSPPTPPTVETRLASNIAQNNVTLTATVNAHGLSATFGFEIGTTTSYGPPTGLGSITAAGSIQTPVAVNLTGLSPGTTYHYRVTATNVDGTSYGADQSFTTTQFTSALATPPAPLQFVAVPAIAFPAETDTVSSVTSKPLTRAQKLAKALKACRKLHNRHRRAVCESQSRRKYGARRK